LATFTGGASIEHVMIAAVAAIAGFAGLMIAYMIFSELCFNQ